MIYDRSYMRDSFERRQAPVFLWLTGILIGVFVLQNMFGTVLSGLLPREGFERVFGLTLSGFLNWHLWTIVTYGFLHDGLIHVIVNLVALFFLWKALEPVVGERRLLGVFLGSVALGGVFSLAVQTASGPMSNTIVLGSSAACFALLTVFSCLAPDRPITVLLFFILPVTIKPRYLAYAAAGISAFCMFFLEIPGKQSVAHSAHLGGMVAGWLYFRYIHSRSFDIGGARTSIELPAWMKKRRSKAASSPDYTVNLSEPHDLKAEVDRILDKINSKGFGSLTDEERRLLDEARESLNKR